MPTYSYACTECGNRFDAVQAFTDDALTTCSQCSGRLRKVFGSVGVVFRGSGFYHNDSRAAAKASTNGSGKSSTSTGSGDTSGSTETSTEKSTEKSTESSGGKSGDKPKSSANSTKAATASG